MPAATQPLSASTTIVVPAPMFDPDVLRRLPVEAQRKYASLNDERADALALTDSARLKLEGLRHDRNVARGELHRLEEADKAGKLQRRTSTAMSDATPASEVGASMPVNQNLERDTARLDSARAHLDALNAAVAEAEAQYRERADRQQSLGRLVGHLEKFIKSLTALVSIVEPPALKKSDTLDAVRAEIASLKKQRSHVAGAPIPVDEAKAKAEHFVEERRKRLAISGLFSRNGKIAFPQEHVGAVGLSPIDLLAWAFPESFVDALHRDIEEQAAEFDATLTNGDQHSTLADIDARILDLERREEALVMRDNAARRSDADPRAVLGVA